MSATLSHFVLSDRLGEGGMGQVWSARHEVTEQPVAVKIVTGRSADEESYRRSFERELETVATLDHPGIVRVYDFGHVDGSCASALDDERLGGCPWFAMQLAESSLEAAGTITDWGTIRRILLELLDALAHAHARGIVHRDLKPGNVLLDTDDGRLRLLLTDFGIAHVFDPDEPVQTEDLEHLTAGTPYYMAPELLRGQWRDFGPWTDLYALGCMAYELVCLRPPFTGASMVDIAMKHVAEPMPALEPAYTVPEGLDAWIEKLVAKRPGDRFQFAADAAWVLQQLSPAEEQEADAPAVTPENTLN